jgi:diguanylate cyclase (GGDEF)-like protein/PAS domain S-box-containing protein
MSSGEAFSPLLRAAAAPEPESQAGAPAAAPARILVIDDDPNAREVLGRLLMRAGHEVVQAESGRAALKLLSEERFDLALLDYMMPDLNGLEVLAEIRRSYGAAQLPVVMVTAKCQAGDLVEALDEGANDYILKPLDLRVTLARVRAQLRTKAEGALNGGGTTVVPQGGDLAFWDWDLHSGLVSYSRRWKALIGYAADELSARPEEWTARIHPADAGAFRAEIERLRTGHAERLEFEYRILHRDGSYRWMLCRGSGYRGTGGRMVRLSGTQSDVTELKTTDSLTALKNQLYFETRLEQALNESRARGRRLGVLLLAVHRLKAVNHGLGYPAGDALLMQVATRIRNAAPGSPDDVARCGPGSFLALAPDLGSELEAAAAGKRLLEAVTPPLTVGGRTIVPVISMGVAFDGDWVEDASGLLKNAQAALYHARTTARGGCTVFDSRMRTPELMKLEMESDLRDALQAGDLTVFYQPKVHLAERRTAGFEALVRWRHPQRGLIAPTEFIPLAEETGLVTDVGNFVLNRACEDLAAWRRAYPSARGLSVSVNLSPVQLSSPALLSQIECALNRSGLPSTSLSLEVTESMLAAEGSARDVLNEIRQTGVKLEIDDFGTGYSSLSYLHRFAFDTLKIDRSFVQDLRRGAESPSIVRTIMLLARSLGMDVVAEGVETEEQRATLQEMGCDFGQGFLFSRPVDAQTIAGSLPAQV